VALLLCTLAASGCAVPMQSTPPTQSDSSIAELRLAAILEDHWAYAQQAWPEFQIWMGNRALNLPDVSLDAAKDHASFARAAIRALEEVRIDALSQDSYVTWLTLHWDMTALQRVPSYVAGDLSFVVPPASPLRTSLDILRRQPLADSADATLFLGLAREFADLADSVRAGLAWRAARGITLPRLLLPRVTRFTRSLIGGAEGSPLAAAGERLALADPASTARFRAALADTIARRVRPALDRLATYLEGAYAARASEQIGLGRLAGGQAQYQALVRLHSTLDITPDEAHAAGLREVAHLDSLAALVRTRLGLPQARAEVVARLRSDTALLVRTPGVVLDRILSEYGRVAASLGAAFRRAPESTADVQAMSPDQESEDALAWYLPPSVRDPVGHYRFNTRRWRDRTMLTLPARVAQDLLPGRHLQAALQRENDSLPAFRRVADHGGYVNGWATYGVELADSLVAMKDGTASQPSLGALEQRLSVACGLVVDTGINYFGWTREQALAFLRAHLSGSDEELERDVIIPAVELPGSLVAAGLGVREFRGLRRWVQRELGDRFDLAAFHDAVLTIGSVPLPVLGQHLEWWIWRTKLEARGQRSEARAGRGASR
jgi:uncharacterized protein (DUF885 family)